MPEDEKLALDAQRAENKAIEELNDRFKASVRQTVSETDWSEIERRLQMQHSADEVGGAVKLQDYDPTDLLKNTFGAASEISAGHIADVVAKGSSLSFTVTDPNALKWLDKYAADEIKYISDSQRDAIKKIVTDGYRDGITYQQQARQIRNCIGLDPRRAATLQKYSDNLFSKGKAEAEVWQLMEAKGKALLNQRARNIAVQEATTAGARGFYETTLDACNRGILDPNIYEAYRIVTGDERLCPRCGGLAGEMRQLPDQAYQSSGSVTPKLHQLCRCVEGLREMKDKRPRQVDRKTLVDQMHAGREDWDSDKYHGFRSKLRSQLETPIKLTNISDESAQILATKLNELDERATNLGIPKIRGVVDVKADAKSLASMGDGVLAVSEDTFAHNAKIEVSRLIELDGKRIVKERDIIHQALSDKADDISRWERNNPKLVANGVKWDDTGFGKDWARGPGQVLKEHEDELAGLESRLSDLEKRGPAALKNVWKPGESLSNRPWGVDEYFDFEDRPSLVLDHEFGHHVHQQLKVTAKNFPKSEKDFTPVEKDIAKLHKTASKSKDFISPSKYSDSDPQEWFAENYTLAVNGRADLVDPRVLKYFKEKKIA